MWFKLFFVGYVIQSGLLASRLRRRANGRAAVLRARAARASASSAANRRACVPAPGCRGRAPAAGPHLSLWTHSKFAGLFPDLLTLGKLQGLVLGFIEARFLRQILVDEIYQIYMCVFPSHLWNPIWKS